MKATVTTTTLLTPRIISIAFTTDTPLRYTAGQFVEITLPHDHPDERGVKRWFTLSSAPVEQILTITTKISPKGSSFKQKLQQLQPGDEFSCSEAMGDFVLPKDPRIPILFIAAGMGITPMRSMAAHLAMRHEDRQCTLIYATSAAEDQVFHDVFARANMHLHQIITGSSKTPSRQQVSAASILHLMPDALQHRIYLAGPETLVETLQNSFFKLGASQAEILTDFFPGYTAG